MYIYIYIPLYVTSAWIYLTARDGNNKRQFNTRQLNIFHCCANLCLLRISTFMQIYTTHGASIGQTWGIKIANSAHELAAQVHENSNSCNSDKRKSIMNFVP